MSTDVESPGHPRPWPMHAKGTIIGWLGRRRRWLGLFEWRSKRDERAMTGLLQACREVYPDLTPRLAFDCLDVEAGP